VDLNINITILVDDKSSDARLPAEHRLSFWLEYEHKRVLFDTGQSDLFLKNANILVINLSYVDAIVISHGHYDHTGGLSEILNRDRKTTLYIHPQALKPKFSRKADNMRMIGMPDAVKQIVNITAESGRVILTKTPAEVLQGLFVAGHIPRNTDFEDTGGDFFANQNCTEKDTLADDQAIFYETREGPVIILGCAHSGVVNTLNYVAKLTNQKNIYAVAGGMHLLNASAERIERTIEALRRYNVQKIGLAHCTGNKAVEKFNIAFPGRCFICSAGSQVNL